MEGETVTTMGLESPGKTRRKKKTRYNRKGSGCVWRPSFKAADGSERFGSWRIRFTYTDDSGQRHTHDEKIEGTHVSQQAAQEVLKKRMEEPRKESADNYGSDG